MEAQTRGLHSRAEYSDRRADCNANMALSGPFLGPRRFSASLRRATALAGYRRLAFTQTGHAAMQDDIAQQILDRTLAPDRAVESLSGPEPGPTDFDAADCFVWNAEGKYLAPVAKPNRIEIGLIKGVDHVRDILCRQHQALCHGVASQQCPAVGRAEAWANHRWSNPFMQPCPATPNCLRRSSSSKSTAKTSIPCRLDGAATPAPARFILFCDDLSFDHDDTAYKSLKAALDGGIEGRPDNALLYATSNRRHLLPRDMMDNERSTAINPSEAVEEKGILV
jgi:hypothetical protein